jgi:anti-sigma factor RsiW
MTHQLKDERDVGGLWCREVLALLTRYLDGDLSADELARVQAHVAGCDACATFGGAFQKAIAAIRDADLTADATDGDTDLSDRVLAAIDT